MNPKADFQPFNDDEYYVLTNVYTLAGLSLEYSTTTGKAIYELESFNVDRYQQYYEENVEYFPKIFLEETIDVNDLDYDKTDKLAIQDTEYLTIYYMILPSNQIVIVVETKFKTNYSNCIKEMLDFYNKKVYINGLLLEKYLTLKLEKSYSKHIIHSLKFLTDYHQLLLFDNEVKFTSKKGKINDDVLQRAIYRADLDYREEFSNIIFPKELNRRKNTVCGISAFVTAAGGQQLYVFNAMKISAIMLVGVLSKLKEIHENSHDTLKIIKENKGFSTDKIKEIREKRKNINNLIEKVETLHLELKFYVDSPSSIGMLIPAMRIEDFHSSLLITMGINEKYNIVENILELLDRHINFEKLHVENLQKEKDNDRRILWSVIVSVVTMIAVPVSILVSYHGLNNESTTKLFNIQDNWQIWIFSFGIFLLAYFTGFIARWLLSRERIQ